MENQIEGIDHVGVVVSNMDQAIDFYTRHLGFSLLTRYQPQNPYQKEIAYLKFPGSSPVKLELYTLLDPPAGEVTYERRLGMREIALSVADVDAEIERLRKAGVEVLATPNFSEAPGVPATSPVKKRTRAAIKAPDGVIVGLYRWH
jgi:catechol 2,3-dioxygenase-like lactoylglutathione lyase family enzyme